MRRRALRWLWLAGVLAALPAQAQHDPPGPPPAGPGTLRGRIVREAAGEVAGLPVVLYALPPDGSPGLAHTTSDAEGRFAFEGISNDPATVYLLGARADELPFGRRVTFAPGQTLADVELRIDVPSSDASAVVVSDVTLRIERGCNGLRVTEVHHLANPTERAIFVPAERRGTALPLLRAELPAGASRLQLPLATLAQGLEQDGERVTFWGPLHPGEHEVQLTYSVPAEPGRLTLARGFPKGATRVVVLSDEGGLSVGGPDLAPAEPRAIDGQSYAAHSTGPLGAGAQLTISLEIPPGGPKQVELVQGQMWLELDDAALLVDEQYAVRNPSSSPAIAGGDEPLLCLAIPEGAEGLRFSPATLAMGTLPDPGGGLAISGPVPPGETPLALRYRLPVGGGTMDFAQRFPQPLDLLSVFVADTGVVPRTDRLHGRRPLRSSDRTYLRLEGFAIEAGEVVGIRFERLAPRRPPSRLASVGFAALAAAAAIAFLVGPLRSEAGEHAPAEPPEVHAESEREAIYAAIRDLDEDHETGKISEADWEQLRGELRARAVRVLEDARAHRERARPGVPAATPGCPACGAQLPADARFCHRCGERLAGEGAGE
jgi:hypothetical protein